MHRCKRQDAQPESRQDEQISKDALSCPRGLEGHVPIVRSKGTSESCPSM